MKKGAAGTAIKAAAGIAAGWMITKKKYKKEVEWRDARIDKFKNYFDLTNEWIRLKNQGIRLEKFFMDNGWSEIAIYGMGELGNRLAEELKNSSITVKYAIDRKTGMTHPEIEVLELGDTLPPVDVIVITPFFMYDVIEEELMDLVSYSIVSIEDVIFFI